MFKLAIKSLLARKLRLVLMVFSIVLGVSFVVATFVVTDSLRATFDNLAVNIESKTDLTVRSVQEFGDSTLRPPVDAAEVDLVKGIDGVAAVDGRLSVYPVTPIKADGKNVSRTGPPLLGLNTSNSPELNQLIQVEGRPPVGEGEFNLDVDAAKDEDFVVGQKYTVSTPAGNREVTLVGTVAFNSLDNDTTGAVLTIFDTPTAQKYFNLEGRFNEIGIAVDKGANVAEVQQRIAAKLPAGVEVVDRTVKVAETQDNFDEGVSILGNALLAFAFITVVVSAFLINNTFRIVIGQRIRELALLRALGATGRQVTMSVIGEALLVGVMATIVGIAAGVGVGIGLKAVFSAVGFSLPDGPIQILPRTVLFATFVGVVVTLISALLPALKVRQIPPIAALRDDFQLHGSGLRRRIITGSIVTAAGAALLALGLFGGLKTAPLLTTLALGALTMFVGVNLLSPIFSVPVARTLGSPIAKFRGVAGQLARDNAARNPRRTSSTAAALMIGVALISMVAVVGSSFKSTFSGLLDNSVEADFFVRPSNFTDLGFSPDLTNALRARPEIESVLPFRFAPQSGRVEGKTKDLGGTNFGDLLQHLNPHVITGDVATASPDSILIHKDSAKDLGLKVGDTIDLTFIDQKVETLKVAAIYDDASILGNWVISLETWDKHFSAGLDQFVTVRSADRTDITAAAKAVEEETAKFPQVKAENREEFKKTQAATIDTFLTIINVMLGFSILVALLGIYNTLRLSIYERTRELGLLRAVGMARSQMRVMIRWEAAIVAVFGAVLGVVLGVLFGFAAASAMPSSFIKSVTIPYGSLFGYVVFAAVAGLIAAILPARRAARLNVLDAISHT